MLKVFPYLCFFSLVFSSCSTKESITPFATAQTLASALNKGHSESNHLEITEDGTIKLKVKYPISPETISPYDSDPANIDAAFLSPVLENFKELFMNVAINLGFGKTKMQLSMDIPQEGINYLHSIKLNRAFFIIDNRNCIKEGYSESVPCSETKYYKEPKKINGQNTKKNERFGFLDKFILNIEGKNTNEFLNKDYEIQIESVSLKDFNDLVKKESPSNILPLASYRKHGNRYIEDNHVEKRMFTIKTRKAFDLYYYLQNSSFYRPQIKTLFKNPGIVTIETDNVTELIKAIKKDPLIDEFEVEKIKKCSWKRCIDLNTTKANILPLLLESNHIDLNMFIDIFALPRKAFFLKGFLEFEIELKLPSA